MSVTIVETADGRLRGTDEGGVRVFRGVRYGETTAAENRYRPPQPVVAWPGVRDATTFAGYAPQTEPGRDRMNPAAHDVVAPGLSLWQGDVYEPRGTESEDCLFLNIWTPARAAGEGLPVLVWLHGGGFDSGSGDEGLYDGAHLARSRGVVVVTVTHRLFSLGYLHLEDLCGEEFAGSGNLGTLDQVAALRWVRANIAAFGGDPDRVLVHGQSGGGWKVSTLLNTRAADGLYRRAAVQSGPAPRALSRERANLSAELFLRRLELTPPRARELRKIPVGDLIAAGFDVERRFGAPVLPNWLPAFAPVEDGCVVDASSRPVLGDVPDLLIGHTDAELSMYVDDEVLDLDAAGLDALSDDWLQEHAAAVRERYRHWYPDASPARLWASIQTDVVMLPDVADIADQHRRAGGRVFVYRIDWAAPALGGRLFAPHAVELPLLFGTHREAPEVVGTGPRVETAWARFSTAWTSFAASGTPELGPGQPAWPPHTGEGRFAMVFDDHPRVEEHPREDRLALIRSIRPTFARRLAERDDRVRAARAGGDAR